MKDDIVLEVKNLFVLFGGLCAVDNFNLSLREGELVGLIGPNGAGKTTIFNVLTGIYPPTRGSIVFRGRVLSQTVARSVGELVEQSILACAAISGMISNGVGLVRGLSIPFWISTGILAGVSIYLGNKVRSILMGRRVLDPMQTTALFLLCAYLLMLPIPMSPILAASLAIVGGSSSLIFLISLIIWAYQYYVKHNRDKLHTFTKPFKITRAGMARTFQNLRLFGGLTVLDNIKVARHLGVKYSVFDSIFKTRRYSEEEKLAEEEGMRLLKIFRLSDFAHERANSLPYGMQRRLEIARALSTRPKLILLDEPAAGMNPQEAAELMELIKWIRGEFDTTILLIEHQMKVVMGICERIVVLDYGEIIAEGTPAEIQANPRVIEAYLGEQVREAVG